MNPLSNSRKLIIVKLFHTLIWLIFVAAILFVCYAGLFNKINRLVWYCVGAVIIEGAVLLINKWKCPLTSIASRYSNAQSIGFDIFIPRWLAKHNKTLFSALFLIGLSLVLWRTI